jgi:hypothetical protein
MDHFLALIRFDVLRSTFWTAVIAATTPNVNPLLAIVWAAIEVDELFLSHFFTSEYHNENYLARGRP